VLLDVSARVESLGAPHQLVPKRKAPEFPGPFDSHACNTRVGTYPPPAKGAASPRRSYLCGVSWESLRH
jgi:hypothetical protein